MKAYQFHGWQEASVREAHGLTPHEVYDLLCRCWSADTCAPRMRSDWTPENRTLGQCSVTAFLVQDLFGGRVLGVPLAEGGVHCFNDVDGCVFDLTSEQFGSTVLDYAHAPEQSREAHFSKAEKRERYELLRSRLLALLPR